MDVMSASLPPFQAGDVDTPPVMLVCAPSCAGKTCLAAWLLSETSRVHGLEAVLVSTCCRDATYMGGILPRGALAPACLGPAALLQTVVEFQQAAGVKRRRMAVVFDDFCVTTKDEKSRAFVDNVRRARELDIMIVFVMYSVRDLPAPLRAIVSHAFVASNTRVDKALEELFPGVEDLAATLRTVPKYNFLVSLLGTGAYNQDVCLRVAQPTLVAASLELEPCEFRWSTSAGSDACDVRAESLSRDLEYQAALTGAVEAAATAAAS